MLRVSTVAPWPLTKKGQSRFFWSRERCFFLALASLAERRKPKIFSVLSTKAHARLVKLSPGEEKRERGTEREREAGVKQTSHAKRYRK